MGLEQAAEVVGDNHLGLTLVEDQKWLLQRIQLCHVLKNRRALFVSSYIMKQMFSWHVLGMLKFWNKPCHLGWEIVPGN